MDGPRGQEAEGSTRPKESTWVGIPRVEGRLLTGGMDGGDVDRGDHVGVGGRRGRASGSRSK